jgi:hypothetical protein
MKMLMYVRLQYISTTPKKENLTNRFVRGNACQMMIDMDVYVGENVDGRLIEALYISFSFIA